MSDIRLSLKSESFTIDPSTLKSIDTTFQLFSTVHNHVVTSLLSSSRERNQFLCSPFVPICTSNKKREGRSTHKKNPLKTNNRDLISLLFFPAVTIPSLFSSYVYLFLLLLLLSSTFSSISFFFRAYSMCLI